MAAIGLAVAFLVSGVTSPVFAYEHQDSLVDFVEYAEDVVAKNRQQSKPYFLLFSAEWCHWCREFAENTLVRQDVADFLNENFVNVFIDTDIHNSAYVRYRATGLPYTVFLNPDGSLYYQYTGTLYGDNFLEVIKEVLTEAGVGKYALGMESSHISYVPPSSLAVTDLTTMPDSFRQGVLDNFDPTEHGLGRGQKSIFPRTFLYLLEQADAAEREQAVQRISKTLEQAIDRIYDPVEGGFFRYAETRDWKIPHFEKFADLNAGIVLLLYQVNQIAPSAKLKLAADKTLAYLTSALFDAEISTFLSFQIADTYYYSVNEKQRESVVKPRVMDKVFTDRLAITLGYLIQILDYSDDRVLEKKIRKSLDFLVGMIMKDGGVKRYYVVTNNQWQQSGGMSDHAQVAKLFADAAAYFDDSRYTEVAARVLRAAVINYFDAKKGIFIDPGVDDSTNVEYLMEMNGLLAQSIIALDDALGSSGLTIIESLISYFSLMGEPLEDRFWNAVGWEFTEIYVPYLQALEKYLSMQNTS
jgi:hypothetical protein